MAAGQLVVEILYHTLVPWQGDEKVGQSGTKVGLVSLRRLRSLRDMLRYSELLHPEHNE